MARYFNTAGPCRPEQHYMLPPERRLPGVRRLIEQGLYFVIHAPRQSGKTTCFRALAESLAAEASYTVLMTTCEPAQAAGGELELGIAAILETLAQDAATYLPRELQPPSPNPELGPATRLRDLLIRWARLSSRPVVLFLDEIDALYDSVLVGVLRQLRSGYHHRPQSFPHAVALIGLRDVRDYRLEDGAVLGTASPFNVKVRSLTLRDFTPEEVAELYTQHTAETGQRWSEAALVRAFELTCGQPWLVNALAAQVTSEALTDRALAIEAEHLEQAKDVLIQRRDTHLDSLIDRLREPRVQRVIASVITGELLSADVLDDDVRFVEDLGLVRDGPMGLEIANPIYREIIPRALTDVLEKSLVPPRPSYVDTAGRLDFARLLSDFVAFWRENAEMYLERAPYSEAAAHLVFMAFLHKITNGNPRASIEREYAAGRGRLDLLVRWRAPTGEVQRWAVELKVWRDSTPGDPEARGLEQLTGYLSRLGLERGTLIVFDSRSGSPPLPQRLSRQEKLHDGHRIDVLRL